MASILVYRGIQSAVSLEPVTAASETTLAIAASEDTIGIAAMSGEEDNANATTT